MSDAELHFVGECVGFNTLGKKCMFIDLFELPATNPTPLNDENTNTGVVEHTTQEQDEKPIIHLVGDHTKRRGPPKQPHNIKPGDVITSVFISNLVLAADGVATDDVRIGDVFKVRATPSETPSTSKRKSCGGRVEYKKANAVNVVRLRRGCQPRPGDYSKKWWECFEAPVAATTTESNGTLMTGKPRQTRCRFTQMVELCISKGLVPRPGAPSPPPKCTVVDVAGGGGSLSVEFASAFMNTGTDVECNIVDPRGKDLVRTSVETCVRKRGKWRSQQLHREAHDDASNTEDKAQRRSRIDAVVSQESAFLLSADRIRHIEALMDHSVSEQRQALLAADVIVGLHCDGAVNAILDAAIDLKKNFAICACCVFPEQFPRAMPSCNESGDGQTKKAVVTRDELNEWIEATARHRGYPGVVGRDRLSFDGANEVVWGCI